MSVKKGFSKLLFYVLITVVVVIFFAYNITINSQRSKASGDKCKSNKICSEDSQCGLGGICSTPIKSKLRRCVCNKVALSVTDAPSDTITAPSAPTVTWSCSGTTPVAKFEWTGGTPNQSYTQSGDGTIISYQYAFSVTVHLLNVGLVGNSQPYYGGLVFSDNTTEANGNMVSIARNIMSTNLRLGNMLSPALVFTAGQKFDVYVSGARQQSEPIETITVPSCP